MTGTQSSLEILVRVDGKKYLLKSNNNKFVFLCNLLINLLLFYLSFSQISVIGCGLYPSLFYRFSGLHTVLNEF